MEKRSLRCEICEKIFINHRAYVCAICSRSFDANCCLIKHFLSHTMTVKIHHCDICKVDFDNEEKLTEHQLSHSDEGTEIACGECNKTFRSLQTFKLHTLVHTPDALHSKFKIYSCPLCDERFDVRRELNIHLSEHSTEGPVTCRTCGLSFRSLSFLITHQDHTHSVNQTCEICGESFDFLPKLAKHMKYHSSQLSKTCSECGIVFTDRRNFIKHYRRHFPASFFSCDVCGRTYKCKERYEEHCNFHIPKHKARGKKQEVYPCNQCGKTFKVRGSLYVHKLVHRSAEHKCDICDKTFKLDRKLVEHWARVHDLEKPCLKKSRRSCKLCNKSNMSAAAHHKHMLTQHTKRDIFKCGICDKSYVTEEKFDIHMKVHEDPDAFKCDICGKKFRSQKLWRAHCFSHTDELPFVCDYCGEKFRYRQKMNTHLKHCEKAPGSRSGKDFKCSICFKEYDELRSLKAHHSVHTKQKLFSCNYCQRKFTWKCSCRKHMKICKSISSESVPNNEVPVSLALYCESADSLTSDRNSILQSISTDEHSLNEILP